MTTAVVLNVDDKPASLYLKSRGLRQAGFQVIEAATGQSALDLALSRRPDVVLLDLKLPDISGFDVCRILKSDPRSKDIPVVHISATFRGEETKLDSAQAGADVYLAEPVGPHELSSTLRTVMRLRATEQTLAESEARLRLVTEGAGIATWDLASAPGTSVWTRHFCSMLGLDPSCAATLETWLERVRPEERDAVKTALTAALRSKGSFAFEHWIVRADNGEPRCIAIYGTPLGPDGGPASRLIGVAIDITDRKHAESEREALLQQARAAQKVAEDAGRMKDEFLAMLSHELRTPMSSVLGWLHLARSGDLPADQQERALEIVERNARLQVQLVNDLLDVSRIITGKLALQEELVAVDAILRNAVESARLPAQARRIELRASLGEGRWIVRGNAARLEQVFSNLLSNAVKFSHEGGSVDVVLERDGEHAVISVSDEGEGIAPELLPHIFESFRQADSSTRRRHGGLGLGLAIVRSLVELHGGHVVAESAGPGRGAQFTVALPLLSGEHIATQGHADREALGPEPLLGLRILVVEDEPDHRELAKHILESNGAEVKSAAGADEALALVEDWTPDLLLLDIAMPMVDGYQLLERLRERLQATADSLPAVALTGLTSASHALRALKAGFQAQQGKPYSVEDLIRTIRHVAGRQKAGSAADPHRVMPRVLIIDDNDDLRTMLQAQLAMEGFDVAAASNGTSALEILARQPADVVLTDLFMPDKDGIETILEIRKSYPQTKIVAMSGWRSRHGPDYLEVAREIGAVSVVHKPFDVAEVARILRRAL